MGRVIALLVVAGCRFSAGGAVASDAAASDTARLDARLDAALAVPALIQVMEPTYSSTSLAVSAGIRAGDLLVVATYTSDLSDALAVTDSDLATWTSVPAVAMIGCAPRLQFWYTTAVTTDADVVTVTQANATAIGMAVLEYTGLDTESPVDVAGGVVAPAAGGIADPGPLVTTQPDVIVGVYADLDGVGTITAGTGLTERGVDTQFYALVGDDVPGVVAGSYDLAAALPAGTDDACWTAAVVALRIATR
ncbi:MAG TPA: hypothetical protein VGF94_00140 [Kofleriaceae bacterium]